MKTHDFFKRQSNLTYAKTMVYKSYIEGYLPKLLLTYGKCLIADLFCGPGMNGDEKGSPLILIDKLNYILSSPILIKRNDLKVQIIFNDENQTFIDSLQQELKKVHYNQNIVTLTIQSNTYESALEHISKETKFKNIPKFYFLDPFTYSNVKVSHLRELMHLQNTEVLLFVPIFHSYRFANTNFGENHKTRIFIEEFTTEGIANYEDVHHFMQSIKKKLIIETGTPYVRPLLLDDGDRKNSLFLLTKHRMGMLLFNKIAMRLSDDGNIVSVGNQSQINLFPTIEVSKNFYNFENLLIDFLSNKERTNEQIVDFAIKEGFAAKQVTACLKELLLKKKIICTDNRNNELNSITKWNIADNIKKLTIIKWVG